MKKRLLTIVTAEIASLCHPFIKNQRKYASIHNYDYLVVPEKHWKDLHPSFSKVYEIDKAFGEGYDIVLWADADVLFMDLNVDLAGLLTDGIFLAAYQQSNWTMWKYLCAGLTVWRNCEQSRDFVADWRERCEIGSPCVQVGKRVIITHHPWEQWYFDELIRECNWSGIRACSANEIGCFCPEIWSDGTTWKDGMPTLHMAGPATWEQRAEILPLYLDRVIKLTC